MLALAFLAVLRAKLSHEREPDKKGGPDFDFRSLSARLRSAAL
jgi:hypothetical protein